MNDNYGILLINKPVGITSFKIVSELRKITKIKKIGHCGTLDPFASGLMILFIGKATKLIKFFDNKTKTYRAKIIFGKISSTGDPEGEFTQTRILNINAIHKKIDSLESFVMNLKTQIPPKFSALKINGKRAYQLARDNIDFELNHRPIKIERFTIIEQKDNYLVYEATVSKGTYIRTLSEQIADYLENDGYTSELERIEIGTTALKTAITTKELTSENWKQFDIKLESLLDFETIQLPEDRILKFKNGLSSFTNIKNTNKVIVKSNNLLLGIARIENNQIVPETVLI